MTPDQLELIIKANEKSTAEVIRLTVNGKIDKIAKNLEDHIKEEKERDKKTDEMYEWWSNLMTTASWTNTIFKYILGTAVALSTIIVAFYKIKGK